MSAHRSHAVRGRTGLAANATGPSRAEPARSGISNQILQQAARTGGQQPGYALDALSRTFMEPRFGRDFGSVRIHTDSATASAAKTLRAEAFTVGRDIHFAEGRYRPDTVQGRRLLAHELTHTVQQGAGANGAEATAKSSDVVPHPNDDSGHQSGSREDRVAVGSPHSVTMVPQTAGRISRAEIGDVGRPGDPHERMADAVAERIASGLAITDLLVSERLAVAPATLQRQPSDDDPEHPPLPEPLTRPDDFLLAPLHKEFDPDFEALDTTSFFPIHDPATFGIPPDTTRADVAYRLYGDDTHVGGFDIFAPGLVRMRSFDGVSEDVVTPMRKALYEQLTTDINSVIDILCQRFIGDEDERALLNTTIRWANRSSLADTDKRSFFDRYLDLLASRTLTEEGVFSDTRRTALEWLLIEAEEKADQIYQLIGTASTRPVVSPRSGEVLPEYTPEKGQLSVGAPVGVFVFRRGEDQMGYRASHGTNNIPPRSTAASQPSPRWRPPAPACSRWRSMFAPLL